jgi:hypothetical protein
MFSGPSGSYSLCRQVSLLGAPGFLAAAVLSIILHGGAHGGGPLTERLLIAAPINFVFDAGMGIAGRAVLKSLKEKE